MEQKQGSFWLNKEMKVTAIQMSMSIENYNIFGIKAGIRLKETYASLR